MAIARLSVGVGWKGKASPHAQYIAREGKYEKPSDSLEKLEHTEHGNMPQWAQADPNFFWKMADEHERKNGSTYREHVISLPRELSESQRLALIHDWIDQEIGDKHAYQFAIHNPPALDGQEQPHCHLMFSERTIDGIDRDPEQYFKRYNGKHPELGGCRKDSAGTEERLLETRQRWAEVQNAHLQQHGHAARVDPRSLADQGIDRAPEQHLGGRRVRQLAPEQREALLERREAEDELRQSQRELAPLDLARHLHELTAAALHREQEEQAARMAEVRAYCRQALDEFRAELARQAERARASEAERERLQRPEAERERPQRPEAEHAPLLEPLPAIGIGSPAFAERLQAALARTMEQLQAQREQAQEPPPQRSRGFDMEP